MISESTEAVLRLRPDAVSWREVDGEVVALDLEGGDYLAINATGSDIWVALADGTTEGALVDSLLKRHHVSRSQAEADVAAFLTALDARSFLERST